MSIILEVTTHGQGGIKLSIVATHNEQFVEQEQKLICLVWFKIW